MPLTNITPSITHVANGQTSEFGFPFQVLKATDLRVTVGGAITTSYTATLATGEGGSITLSSPPSQGLSVRIRRVTDLTRPTDYRTQGDLLAKTLNRDFLRLWHAIQEIDRRIVTLETVPGVPTPAPAPTPGAPAPVAQAPAIPLPVVDFYATIVTVAPIPAPPPVGAPPPAVAPYSGTFDLYRNGIALQTDALLMAQVPPDRRMFVDSPVTLTLVPQDTRVTSGTINWGDGSALENYTAGQTASHTFNPGNASNFTVTFTGTTPDGVVFGYRYLYVEAIPAPAPPPNVPRIASAAFVPSVLNVGQATSLTINFAGLTPGATSTMAYTVIGQTGLTGYFGDATRVVTADAAGNAFAVEPYTAAATGQAQVSHGVQVSGLASYVLASLTVNDPAVSSPTPPPPPPPPPPPVFASFTGPGGVVGAGEQFDVSLTITGLPANAVAPISASFGASPRLSGPVGQTVTLTANANAAGTAVVPVQFGVIASAPTSQATLSATCQGVVRSTVIEIEAAPPVGGGGLGPEGTA